MNLGCIADDYTGATDLSSMLVRAGLRVVQVFGSESKVGFDEANAVVLALKSRSVPAAEAVSESLKALRFLQSIGAERYFFKYCSTFDSTPAGNIGPVAEALADQLRLDRLWYCPSFPENGRTVYCANLFVNRVPLHESGMKDHPLNPMKDSNLVRVLQAQCRNRVDCLTLEELRCGNIGRCFMPDAARHWIVDAISNKDLERVARLAGDSLMLTGGSAIAYYWAALNGGQEGSQPGISTVPASREAVILAGSCSVATRRQIDAFAAAGYPVLRLDVLAAAASPEAFQLVAAQAVSWCMEYRNSPCLVASGQDAGSVASAAALLGELRSARLTEALFGAIARNLSAQGVNRLVVAGGETSGSVVKALEIDAVLIGEEIAPGVPCVHTMHAPYISLVLKSGNFGEADFFMSAARRLTIS